MAGKPDLRALRKKNVNKIIITRLNANSLKNKVEFPKSKFRMTEIS